MGQSPLSSRRASPSGGRGPTELGAWPRVYDAMAAEWELAQSHDQLWRSTGDILGEPDYELSVQFRAEQPFNGPPLSSSLVLKLPFHPVLNICLPSQLEPSPDVDLPCPHASAHPGGGAAGGTRRLLCVLRDGQSGCQGDLAYYTLRAQTRATADHMRTHRGRETGVRGLQSKPLWAFPGKGRQGTGALRAG